MIVPAEVQFTTFSSFLDAGFFFHCHSKYRKQQKINIIENTID
jgi:hypothetical protein